MSRIAKIKCPHCGNRVLVRVKGTTNGGGKVPPADKAIEDAFESAFKTMDKAFDTLSAAFDKVFRRRPKP